MARNPRTTPPAAPNKAQAEFERYTERRAKAAAAGAAPAAAGALPSSPFPGEGLTWTAPLGVGMAPVHMAGPHHGPGHHGGGAAAVGELAEGLGTAARLGVDLLNAALANSVKILGGFTSAYGYGHEEGRGCGGGCGCDSCCEPSCCQSDCCGCDCCHPGVGNCC
jgi:hypothetical protein